MTATYNGETLYVDNTILSTFATCPLRAAISYGLDRRPLTKNANLEVGSALHKALEAYLIGASPDECVEILRQEYKEFADTLFDDKRLSWPNIERVLRTWIDKYPYDKLPFSVDPKNIEIAFEVPLNETGDILFTGRIDVLARARSFSSSYFAIDHKTTGRVDSTKKREYSITSQMSGYLWALNQTGYQVDGIYINIVHTGVVPTSDSKCKTHKAPYSECGFLHMKHERVGPYQRSDKEIADWKVDATSLALEWRQTLNILDNDIENLDRMQQRGKWIYNACTNCPWFNYCKSGRPQHWLKENTIVDPWLPGTLGDKEEENGNKK